MPTTTTENLYLAAYLAAEGAELRNVLVSRSNGRATAVFELESPDASRLAGLFYSSAAIVNLAAYRHHLEALKDRLFAALRETQIERRAEDAHPRARSLARR